MGVSKGEGGGRWSPPNGWRSLVLGERGPCRIWRSGGFPNFPGKSSPSSPSPTLSTPFSPLDPFLQFFLPSNASLQLSRESLYQPFLPLLPLPFLFFSFFVLPTLLRPPSDLFRTPSESLHRVPKRPKKILFRAF